MASVGDSSDDKTNALTLYRLIVDLGTEALRRTFNRCNPGNLQAVLSTHKHTLLRLKHGNVVTKSQWEKLYPATPNPPNINDFDITLLSLLLRNICSLKLPSHPIWANKKPNPSDYCAEADIVRIRSFRNDFSHMSHTAVSDADFMSLWAEISAPLVRLGIDQSAIDELKNELLNKHLVWCNFQSEIEFYYEKFTEGTREWVFEEFLNWFKNENSKNRAFIISGLAGMGKSVIAAAVCKQFAEHIAACHFFQYNNSQYDNPKIFLQSVAWQICQVFPAYKKALVRKLTSNLAQPLNVMNIEGLFTTLLKEPFTDIADPGKTILIVLDAVDECENKERDELASLISNHLHKLPPYIRFLITTRPEKHLIAKFAKLNPLYIKSNDARNLCDLKMVLRETISQASDRMPDLIDKLAEKSDGLMLYAFFLSEIYNDDPSTFDIENLPIGIEEHYERYFDRLEGELGRLEILEDKLFSFLSALAVSREPLPDSFVEILLGIENSPRKAQKVKKAISSLLVINEDKSISFFHKSLRDWLVDHSDHNYSVKVQHGHKILFDLCVLKLDELKVSGVTYLAKTNPAIEYSVKYWISHMLNGPENSGKLDSFVNNYVTDLEVMFTSVYFNVGLTLDNISNLTKYKIYDHVYESTRAVVERLYFVIRKFAFLLRDYPHTFLQTVVNESEGDLSSKASSLLQTRYKDIVYLEFVEKDGKNDALETRCSFSGTISGIDISPNHDYIICSYTEGGIELFSTAALMSVWKKTDFELEQPPPLPLPNFLGGPCMLRHFIVFYPRDNFILPGRLDEVLTVEGEFRSGPFQCDENCSKFTNCCFSSDNCRMVTNYGNDLIVWNVASGGKEICLSCNTLVSFSFTSSGDYLGTVDIENVFKVYDISNDYTFKSLKLTSQFPVEILSTFEQNSWFCSVDRFVISVEHTMKISFYYVGLFDILLPSSLHYCDELKSHLQYPEKSWFSKVRQFFNRTLCWSSLDAFRYILIGSTSVLIYSRRSNVMHMFSIEDLVDGEEQAFIKGVSSNISPNGDLAYLNNVCAQKLTIWNLESSTKSSSAFENSSMLNIPIVRDGVILYDKDRIPRLWNSDITQRLSTFHKLAGMERCFSVSEEVIACKFNFYVIFFNVFTKEIENETNFNEKVLSVYACSIKYHVLAQVESCEFSLWRNGIKVDGWEEVFRANTSLRCIFCAEFSPQGDRLALFSTEINKIFIFDILSVRYVAQVPIRGPYNDFLRLKFFDNENLVCGSTSHILYFINVDRGEILTCLDMGNIPAPISVSHKRGIVFAGLNYSENFELIKVWLHRN